MPPAMPWLLEGRWVRGNTQGQSPGFPVCIIQEAGEPRAAPCLSFFVTVSPELPRRSAVEAGRLAGLGDPRLGAPSLIISPQLSPPRSS